MIRRVALLMGLLAVMGLAALRVSRTHSHPVALGSFGHGPTIVLVHGLGSSAEHWLPMARDLARDHRIVLVDLPGHGLAAMPDKLTLESAALLLDHEIVEQDASPVVLVGHSVGGLVAAVETLAHPEHVRALVLIETALRPQLSAPDRAALLNAFERDYRGTLHASYRAFGRDTIQGDALFAEAAKLDSNIVKPWVRIAITTDLSHEIANLRVPVLVVLAPHSWGSEESWASVADSLGYTLAPRVTPMLMAGCGHFVMLDRPQALASAIRRFAADATPQVVALR